MAQDGIFITGGSGYLGSYVSDCILRNSNKSLNVLIRAKNEIAALEKLWNAWQLHMSSEDFHEYLGQRVHLYLGDITQIKLGLSDELYRNLVDSTESVLHVAASLNRRSSRVCFNVNLRGTLHVIQLAKTIERTHGLRRFSEVSTVAVAGVRQDEVVLENQIIDWDRPDYDPYAQTKKFGEYMVEELLSEVPTTVFRPSIVLGDSRFPETTQFDMVKAFVWLSKLPLLPFNPDWRLDIVPADFVGQAIAKIHLKDHADFMSYNLSSGGDSLTFKEIVDALNDNAEKVSTWFLPSLNRPLAKAVDALANTPRSWRLSGPFSLLKVFWPYLSFNTVFDNTRVVQELGVKPIPFSYYAGALRRFAIDHKFKFPHKALTVTSLKKAVA